jgi:hypothetical protein
MPVSSIESRLGLVPQKGLRDLRKPDSSVQPDSAFAERVLGRVRRVMK